MIYFCELITIQNMKEFYTAIVKGVFKFILAGFILVVSSNDVESQNSSSIVRTNPSGAEVFDENNLKIGETPFDLSKLKLGSNSLHLVKENYETIEISFVEKLKRKELIFPNSILECKNCILKLDSIKAENIVSTSIQFFKNFSEIDKTIIIGIDNPVLDIKEDVEIGRLNGSKRKLKDKDIYRLLGYPENMEMKMLNAFENSNVNAVFFSKKNFKKNVSTLQIPKIILQPIVKKITFNLNGDLLRDYSGLCTVVCDWQICDLSNTEKNIETITTSTSFYRTPDNYELLLHQMVFLAGRDLLDNETFFSHIEKYQKTYLESSKGEVIKLKLSSNADYSNNVQMLNEVKKSVVTVDCNTKFGSGVFITDDGYILTNYHVVDEDSEIFVKIENEKKLKAILVKVNKDFDLAILKVNLSSSRGVFLLNSHNTSVGEDVFAIGTPLEKTLGQTVTRGIVSGYREWGGSDFIQTDVSINSGNSGGPLLNTKGEIIGINTLKASGKNISGIGFAIPSDIIIKMLNISNP